MHHAPQHWTMVSDCGARRKGCSHLKRAHTRSGGDPRSCARGFGLLITRLLGEFISPFL
jgi:hypothetical protein